MLSILEYRFQNPFRWRIPKNTAKNLRDINNVVFFSIFLWSRQKLPKRSRTKILISYLSQILLMDINWYDWKNARRIVFIKTTVGSELAQTDLKNDEIRTANDEVSLLPCRWLYLNSIKQKNRIWSWFNRSC